MKLRAKKGEGAVIAEELARARLRPDLPHRRRRRPARRGSCSKAASTKPAAKSINSSDIFGPKNVYVELQRHFQREEESRNRAAIDIAQSCIFLCSPPTESATPLPQSRELCDVFTAIRHHRTLSTAGRLLARNSERYLKSPQEMQQLFADLPEAIANTLELSSRLEFTLNDLGYEFPRYPVPEGETMDSFLRERAWEGFRHRYGRTSQDMQTRARLQIEKELKLIEKLKLAGYFLIVWDSSASAASKTFWFRAAARPPTAPSATRSASPPSIPSAWNFSSNAFFPKNAASGPTSISTCPAATSANVSSSTSTSATANAAPP